MAEKKLKTLQFEGLNTTYVLPEVDPTSSIPGDAADAKIVGDHLTDVNNPHGVTLEQLGASKTIVTDENQDGHITLKSYLSDSGSGNISTHVSDRSNPHKVTAVQVGADVSGAAKQALEDAKGYTDEVITNLIGGAPDTLNTLQELAEAMEANTEVVDVLEKAITGKADNSVLTAHIDNKNNPHNVTIGQIGAAPAGYGLGGGSKEIDDWNTAISNGFYRSSGSCINGPVAGSQYHGVMINYSSALGNQFVFKTWADGVSEIWTRRYYNGEFGAWHPVLTDKNIGTYAAPASIISYTIAPSAVGELDTLLKSAYNAMGQNTRKFIYVNMMFEDGLSGGIWQLTLAKTTNDYGFIIAEGYAPNPSPIVKTRTIYCGAWGNWYDISANTFAPSGYGLGGMAKKLTSNDNLDDVWECGYYAWYNVEPVNAPSFGGQGGAKFAIMHVNALDKYSFVQEVTYIYYGQPNLTQKRTKTDTLLGEWEYVNPPMVPGVEYRTTERYNGKAVYTKLVDLGESAHSKVVYVLEGNARIIRHQAMYGGNTTLPFINETLDNAFSMWTAVDKGGVAIKIFCGSSRVGGAMTAQIWYTKD